MGEGKRGGRRPGSYGEVNMEKIKVFLTTFCQKKDT
jgi:hypothetical protein